MEPNRTFHHTSRNETSGNKNNNKKKVENNLQKGENQLKEKIDYKENTEEYAAIDVIKSTNNLEKFKHIVSETSKNRLPFENSSSKRVRTAGDFYPRRTEFNLQTTQIPKSVYEAQKQGAKEYERIIKTSHDQRREGKQFIPNTRLISEKMLESDIFCLSSNNRAEEKMNLYGAANDPRQSSYKFYSRNNEMNKIITKDYLNSDVFAQKNNEASQKKIGERYLKFNDNKYNKISYYPSAKSNSEWSPRSKVKSFMNHNSTEYDLFNSNRKNPFFTREKIQCESNGVNPINRQKSISEFVDLTRNFVPNYNKEFVNAIGKDEMIFSKKQNLCVNFLDLHKEYNNLCDKPFIKKSV